MSLPLSCYIHVYLISEPTRQSVSTYNFLNYGGTLLTRAGKKYQEDIVVSPPGTHRSKQNGCATTLLRNISIHSLISKSNFTSQLKHGSLVPHCIYLHSLLVSLLKIEDLGFGLVLIFSNSTGSECG